MDAPAAPPPVRRRRPARWLAWGGLGVLGAVVLAVVALMAWLPDDDEVAQRTAQEFERRFGVALTIGNARWALRPVPVIEFRDVATQQDQPIALRRLAVYPQWRSLLQRRIEMSRLEVEGLVLPRASVRAFRGREKRADDPPASSTWTLADIPVHTVRFSDVSWIDRRGIGLAYDGEIEFGSRWRPREVQVERPGVSPPARAHITRDGEVIDDSAGQGDVGTERWRVAVEVGGGSWDGDATLATEPDGRMRLTAQLAPKDIDLEALTGAFGRHSAVAGRMSGETMLEANGEHVGELVRSLHTRTRFKVHPATLRRFDLARTVTTAGTQREGQTVLDELTGTLDTQNTGDGIALHYIDLRARSGVLTASGDVRVLNRRLQGDVAVDLVDGVVGFPLKLGGTLDKPELSLTGGALAGAAAGSAVLPGVGTAIGARIGQKLERLFGSEDAPAKKAERRNRSNSR